MNIHIIERRRDGYKPTQQTVAFVLKEAKRHGFRTDWIYCGVLDDGALSFGNPDETNLIAFKFRGQDWRFVTEREYLSGEHLERKDEEAGK